MQWFQQEKRLQTNFRSNNIIKIREYLKIEIQYNQVRISWILYLFAISMISLFFASTNCESREKASSNYNWNVDKILILADQVPHEKRFLQ